MGRNKGDQLQMKPKRNQLQMKPKTAAHSHSHANQRALTGVTIIDQATVVASEGADQLAPMRPCVL